MTVDEVIGRNVHHLLWEKRIKQQQMIDALGVTRTSLHRRLRGETPWLARDIEAAARVLDVPPGALFSGHVTGEKLAAFAARVLRLPLRMAS